MGSSNTPRPAYDPNPSGTLLDQQNIEKRILDRYYNGLTAEEEAQMRNAGTDLIGASDRETRMRNEEAIAGLGNSPGTIRVGANREADRNQGSNLVQLNRTIQDADRQAKDVGFNQYAAEQALLHNTNQGNYNASMASYRADHEGDFDWGSAIGSAAGVAGAVAPVTCFCYAETFGKYSREYKVAARWARLNASQQTIDGYVIFSSLVIPLMRKSKRFKKIFREKIAIKGYNVMKDKTNSSFADKIVFKLFLGLCNFVGAVFSPTSEQLKTVNTVFSDVRKSI